MLRETIICDKCGAETDLSVRERSMGCISLLNGQRSSDPGGGPSSDDTADLDLCQQCMGALCRYVLRDYVVKEKHLEILRHLYPTFVPMRASS